MAKIIEPEAIEQGQVYTLREVCLRYCLDSEFVIQCVDFGITEVREGGKAETWQFPVESVSRLEKAWRLQHDLGLDFTGLAIVLDLLDEIDQLNGRVDSLSRRLSEWEE